jgi:mono/diheme cytochrome c family protein
MTARALAAVLVVLAAAGCHRQAVAPAADPMLEALRLEEQTAGLTYAEGQGKHLFDQYCVTCHGDGGKGDGQNASNLNPAAPDLTTSKNLADVAYVRRVIVEGSAAVGRSPLSPPWGRSLSPQEIEYVTLYCRALAAKTGQLPPTGPR